MVEQFKDGPWPNDYLGLALSGVILGGLSSCLFCLPWIPGALAMTFASQTRTNIQKKNYDKAWKTSQVAQISGAIGCVIGLLGFLIWWGMFAYAMVQYNDPENQKKYDMNFWAMAFWWLPSDVRFPPKQ